MPFNTGGPFFHPVTHTLISTGMFYVGAAHQDHENEPEEELAGTEEEAAEAKAKAQAAKASTKKK